MQTMPISKIGDFLYHVAYRRREPVMIWGEPGLGKTDIIGQFAQRINAHLCGERFGQIQSVDVRGLPDLANGRTRWCPPESWPFEANAEFFPKDQPIVFFMDEINGATSQGMFALAMQVSNERRAGPHKLMDNVILVAAGNREGDRAIACKMPTTNANRFTHVEAGRDVEGWCVHMTEKHGAAFSIACAFYMWRKDLLYTFDPNDPKKLNEKAFSTGRTAEKAWLYYADKEMPDEIKSAAMEGVIGSANALQARAFIETWSKIIPVSKIIADPKKCELPEEPSMQYATTMSISGSMDHKNVKPLTEYLCRMTPEFAVLAWSLAVKRDDKLYNTPEYIAFAKKYRTVFI
jgi:hypothetical protein